MMLLCASTALLEAFLNRTSRGTIIDGDEVIAELNLERLRPSEQGDYKCVGFTSLRPEDPFSYTTKIRKHSIFHCFCT